MYYRGSVSLYDDLDILDEKITASATQQIALLCLQGPGGSQIKTGKLTSDYKQRQVLSDERACVCINYAEYWQCCKYGGLNISIGTFPWPDPWLELKP